jgi:hypothetical protein
MEKVKTEIIGIENSWKNHNKIVRKPVEKKVIYNVEIKAKAYVFLKFIFI